MDRQFPLNQRSALFYLEEDTLDPHKQDSESYWHTGSSDGKVGQSSYVLATLEVSLA